MNFRRLFSRRRLSRRPLRTILSVSIAALSAPWSLAATETWNVFTGTANFALDASWLDGTQPIGGDPTLDLIFGALGAETYTANNDIVGLLLNTLTFTSTSSAPITITGNALDFRTDGTTPEIIQNGSGAVAINAPIIATDALTLSGTGTGLVTIGGAISGSALTFGGGNWLLTNVSNSYVGGTTINTGAFVELAPAGAAPQSIAFGLAGASLLGSGSPLTLDGGTLKLTTKGNGNIQLGAARPVTFGPNGGTLRIVNTNVPGTQGGNIAGGDLAVTLNSSAGTPGVIQWNGGQVGLQTNNPNDGNWGSGTNALRISSYVGTGPLRVEVTNGASFRLGNGSTASPQTITAPITLRGVVGGDPTSGPAGSVLTGISLTTGRIVIDNANEHTYSNSLVLEGALQVGVVGTTRALNGQITIGNGGYIAFTGRGTGTQLNATVNPPGTNTAGQNPLWVLRNNNGLFTVQDGGLAVFDPRLRTDTGGANGNGVALDGRAVLNAGGTLRIQQSVSNFTPGIPSTTANVGDIIIYGDIQGEGTTAKEANVTILLPEPQPGSPVASTIPATLTATTTVASERPYGGLRFDDTRGLADFIINGTGLGGLRINATARPNNLLQGGAADPVGNDVKLASVLTAARLARITGSGGYLTPAPDAAVFNFPAGGEWNAAVPVGLKVVNHNAGGADVSLGAQSTWNHNLAIETGAELSLGAGGLTLNAGTLAGTGTVGGGNLTIANGSVLAPGLGLGTITVGNITLNGSLAFEAANTPASDLLQVNGNLALGPASVLAFAAGNTYAGDYVLAAYTGTLTGTFGSVQNLPPDYALDYGTGTAGQIRLVFTVVDTVVWDGTVNGNWNAATPNWKVNQTYTNGDKVVFDDTAVGSTDVIVSNGPVSPAQITVNNSTRAYSITASAGNEIIGVATLTKSGTGAVTLSGPVGHGGGTQITAGTLRLGSDNVLSDSGPVSVSAGATFDLNGRTDTIGALTVNGAITAGALAVNSLSVGTGGTIPVNFTLGGGVAITAAAGVTFSGTINLGNGARAFDVPAQVAPELTISGIVSNGALTKSGTGSLVLGAVNTYAGPTIVAGGTLRAGTSGALPAGSDVTVAAGATLDSAAIAQTLGTLDLSGRFLTDGAALSVTRLAGGASGQLEMAGGPLTVAPAAIATYVGTIIGTSTTVTKNGAGAQHLGGANSYDGVTQVNAGVLSLDNAGAAGSSPIVVNAGGALDLGAVITNVVNLNGGVLGATTGSAFEGTLNALAPSTLRNADPEALGTQSELIIQGGGLQGTADLLVQTNNGDTSADNGAGIRLRSPAMSNYSGTITVANTTKFELQAVTNGPFSPMGTGKIKLAAGTFAAALQGTYGEINLRNNSGGDTTFGNDLEIIGSGLANLGGLGTAPANSRTIMGNLKIGGTQTLGANRNTAAGVFNLVMAFPTVTLTGGDAGFSPTTAGFGFTLTNDIALGPISESAPSGIVMSGTTFLFLEGANTYTGGTTIQSGTVRLGAAGALPVTTALNLAGGTLDLSHPTLGSFDQTVASFSGLGGVVTNSDTLNVRAFTVDTTADSSFLGQFTGALGLVKRGAGKLTLGNANAHTGPTDVQGGALVLGINGTLIGSTPIQLGLAGKLDVTAFGATGFTIGPAQTLSGSGDWDGRIVLDGTLAPGPALATLTGDSIAVDSGATMQLALSTLDNTSDRLALTGAFDKDSAGTFTFDFDTGGALNQTYTLVTFASTTFVAADFLATDLAAGVTGSFQMTPTELQFVTIPEPTSAALLLGAVTLLGVQRRRK